MSTFFDWYEIRPCVTVDGQTESFRGLSWSDQHGEQIFTHDAALAAAQAAYPGSPVFWTLYGHDSAGEFSAIGDFETLETALQIMNAILAPMANIRDRLESGGDARACACDLDDIINQSSNDVRP